MDVARQLRDWFARERPRGVLCAWLFGSHAAGRAHRESDVDVGILLDRRTFPTAEDRSNARMKLIIDLMSALGSNEVDLVELGDVSPELGAAVVQRGERIYAPDEPVCHAFVRDVQIRAADLRPWLRWTRRIKLEAIQR
ncbi:MAG: nucleotidyltransferase domain-containing protein [Myxococcales bacterium]|nr:nucleotidyltransferase domain-containing protein [Myxococcales bacterium]